MQSSGIEVFFPGGLHRETGLIFRRACDQGYNLRLVSSSSSATGDFPMIAGPGLEGTLMAAAADMREGPGAVDVVTFTDAGNVFLKASSIDLFDLRPAAGFGVHYRSPVGPVRVELGFNLDRQELVPGQLERAYVLHISLGQAF